MIRRATVLSAHPNIIITNTVSKRLFWVTGERWARRTEQPCIASAIWQLSALLVSKNTSPQGRKNFRKMADSKKKKKFGTWVTWKFFPFFFFFFFETSPWSCSRGERPWVEIQCKYLNIARTHILLLYTHGLVGGLGGRGLRGAGRAGHLVARDYSGARDGERVRVKWDGGC